jgi:hypothetical protein
MFFVCYSSRLCKLDAIDLNRVSIQFLNGLYGSNELLLSHSPQNGA